MSLSYILTHQVFYIMSTTLLKVSLGLFFLRILTGTWPTPLLRTVIGFNILVGVIYTFIMIFQCGNPIRLAESMTGSPDCVPRGFTLSVGYVYGTINAMTDWSFVFVSIFVLVRSGLHLWTKVSVGAVILVGTLGSIACIMRMVYLSALLSGPGRITRKWLAFLVDEHNFVCDCVAPNRWLTPEQLLPSRQLHGQQQNLGQASSPPPWQPWDHWCTKSPREDKSTSSNIAQYVPPVCILVGS